MALYVLPHYRRPRPEYCLAYPRLADAASCGNAVRSLSGDIGKPCAVEHDLNKTRDQTMPRWQLQAYSAPGSDHSRSRSIPAVSVESRLSAQIAWLTGDGQNRIAEMPRWRKGPLGNHPDQWNPPLPERFVATLNSSTDSNSSTSARVGGSKSASGVGPMTIS